MTAYRFVTLTCDECGEIFDDGKARLVVEARRGAKQEGWTREGRKDLCPRHNGYTYSDVQGWHRDRPVAVSTVDKAHYCMSAAQVGA